MRRTFGGAKVRSNGATYAVLRRLYGSFAAAADRAPVDFTELLLTPSVSAKTVRALAMVAEVVHGAPYRLSDPTRFSFAHGGGCRPLLGEPPTILRFLAGAH